ncbi:MAG: helix-turn-helix domain-containing protein [Oscillospiraceae bacterium]
MFGRSLCITKELQELMRTYSSMKALQLLVALADCEGEISLAQLSAATGIPPSSTHRILQEMQHCGFVIKDEVKKCYRAGFEARLLSLTAQKTNFLYEAARGEMAYAERSEPGDHPPHRGGRIWRPSIWQSWGQRAL